MRRKFIAIILGVSLLHPVAANAAELTREPDGSCKVRTSAEEKKVLPPGGQGYFAVGNLVAALADVDPQVKANKDKLIDMLVDLQKWEAEGATDPAPARLTEFLDAFSPVYSLIERVITPKGMAMYREKVYQYAAGIDKVVSDTERLSEKQKNSLIALNYLHTVTAIDRSNSVLIGRVYPEESNTDTVFGANRVTAKGLGLENVVAGYEMVNDLLPSYSVTIHRALAQACADGKTDFNYKDHFSPTIVGHIVEQPEHQPEHQPEQEQHSLGAGEIAGIVIGALAALGVLGVILARLLPHAR